MARRLCRPAAGAKFVAKTSMHAFIRFHRRAKYASAKLKSRCVAIRSPRFWPRPRTAPLIAPPRRSDTRRTAGRRRRLPGLPPPPPPPAPASCAHSNPEIPAPLSPVVRTGRHTASPLPLIPALMTCPHGRQSRPASALGRRRYRCGTRTPARRFSLSGSFMHHGGCGLPVSPDPPWTQSIRVQWPH